MIIVTATVVWCIREQRPAIWAISEGKMNRFGRSIVARLDPSFFPVMERYFGKGFSDALAVLIGLAVIAQCLRVALWALTGDMK